jgi:archaellum component FlaF (FlaF/FlaG flagellin family)
MRMFSVSTSVVVGSALLLSACVSMYSVRPVVAENQIPVQNQGFESLSSKKKHMVQVGSVYNSMRQFDNPRFNVTFVNNGKFPVEFSTENVTVAFNGEPAAVVSYEAQIQDVQNRLSFYGMRAPIFYSPFYYPPFHRGFHGGSVFLHTDFNDRVDVQQAFADFERIQKYSLKPRVVRPGEQTQGEIIVSRKLSASSAQDITVTVRVDDDTHKFDFGYLQTN